MDHKEVLGGFFTSFPLEKDRADGVHSIDRGTTIYLIVDSTTNTTIL
jgi:hypothetical protein